MIKEGILEQLGEQEGRKNNGMSNKIGTGILFLMSFINYIW